MEFKKKVTVTLELIWDVNDEFDDMKPEDYTCLAQIRDADYDNIDRPLDRMEDLDWEIVSSKVEDVI